VESSSEHGSEPSGSIKCWEILEYLHNWLLLKKDSAPQVSELYVTMEIYYLSDAHNLRNNT
jgi:hypothetical protein